MRSNRFPTSYLVCLCALSLLGAGCEAFNDHPQEQEILSSLNLMPEAAPAEETPTAEPTTVGSVDYSTDATTCDAATAVTVSAAEVASVTENSGYSSEGSNTVAVKALGQFTNEITIAPSSAGLVVGEAVQQLTIVIKQTGEKSFSVCSVAYSDGSQTYAVQSGAVVIERFNAVGEDGAVTNAGSYDLTFAANNDVASAARVILGMKAGANGVTLLGTYYVNTPTVTE
ncbi:MAG: hypothetical protein HY696_06130 [Deltaproteobacteria bacterium]|nr:hypothetical protein [Deltaproteobacteria bacterium]